MTEKVKNKLLSLKLKKELAVDKTRRSTNLLYYVAIFNLVFGLVEMVRSGQFITLIFSSSVSLVLIILAILSRKSPMIPLIVAFFLLLGAFSLDFLKYDLIGFLGVALRLVVLFLLGSGIYHIIIADKILSEYDKFEREIHE